MWDDPFRRIRWFALFALALVLAANPVIAHRVLPAGKAGAGAGLSPRSAELQHWAFQPVRIVSLPPVKSAAWCVTPIDRFVLAALERRGMHPAPPADRRTLLRRVTYDLIGLPPSPDEIANFLADRRSNAYEKVVDRLLASPRYGERWARHWLDVAHYGDTHGYDKDKRRDHAWPYRDYVIRAFNEDRPYSRFVQEQVAGDVLFPNTPDGVTATGFLAAGPWDYVGNVELAEGTVEKEKTRLLDRDDMVSNVMATFNSVTIHCARCHDHKFDPIPQRDYYRLQAVFAGVERGDRPYGEPKNMAERTELDRREHDLTAARTALKQKIAAISSPEIAGFDREIADVASRRARLGQSELVYTVLPRAPRPIQILARGDVEKPAGLVGPGALSCLLSLPGGFDIAATSPEGERRAALAHWISSPSNPLTWRSIVNRIWAYHFGQGIVDTPNDFGRNGSRPSHPELLDWLARTFVDAEAGHVTRPQSKVENRKSKIDAPWACGQSLKRLHRVIVLSATYRQSTRIDPVYTTRDGDNRLLWRMNRQRLDAEGVRDAVLAVSGKLDLTMGGPGFDLFRFKDDHSPVYDYTAPGIADRPETWRRAVYAFTVRSVQNPFIECLDGADPNLPTPVRSTTLTALQALALLNDPFILRQSAFCAERLKREHSDPSGQISAAYELAFGRDPMPAEASNLIGFASKHGLAAACRLLFNANEFLFVD